MMAAGLPARRLPPRGHDRPPARPTIDTAHGIGGKVNPPHPPARGRRGALGAPAGRRRRLGRVRPRLLPGRDEVRRRPRRRLPGQVRLRRHRVPAARAGQRGPQARAVAAAHRRSWSAGTRPSGTACATKGDLGVGLRRRLRAGRPATTSFVVRAERLGVDPGVHAVRGLRARRPASPTPGCGAAGCWSGATSSVVRPVATSAGPPVPDRPA